MLDVELLGCCGSTCSTGVRTVGCTAKFSETPLETAFGGEMNIQSMGSSSGGRSWDGSSRKGEVFRFRHICEQYLRKMGLLCTWCTWCSAHEKWEQKIRFCVYIFALYKFVNAGVRCNAPSSVDGVRGGIRLLINPNELFVQSGL